MNEMASKVRMLIAEHRVKNKEVAVAIGNDSSLFSLKVNGKVGFSIKDMFAICDYFNITPDYFYKTKGA